MTSTPALHHDSSAQKRAVVRIGAIEVTDITIPEIIELIASSIENRRSLRLFYANAHAVRLAAEDSQFAAALARGDLVFCDGHGVKMAARLLGSHLRARLTPPDWIRALVERLGSNARLYLVGDEADVVEAAAARIRRVHPLSEIVGAHHGFFAFPGPEQDRLIAHITEAAPTLLLVGMGMPRQELWINAAAPHLGGTTMLAVGALFRRLSGDDPAPLGWMSNAGFEWVHRFVAHPVRHFNRYVVGLPKFALIIARQRYRGWRSR